MALVLAKTHKKKKTSSATVEHHTDRQLVVRDDNKHLLANLKGIADSQQRVVSLLGKSLIERRNGDTVKLLSQLRDLGVGHAKLGRFMNIALGQIFQYLKEHWKELPDEFKQQYDDDYYAYIQETYNLGPQMSDMYACVWEAYYSGTYKVEVPDFVNISEISITKLNLAARYIFKEKMTKTRWRVLANTALTRHELAAELRGAHKPVAVIDGVKARKDSTRAKFYRNTGELVMYLQGQKEQVAHFNIESSNPVVLTEIRRILIMAEIYYGRD